MIPPVDYRPSHEKKMEKCHATLGRWGVGKRAQFFVYSYADVAAHLVLQELIASYDT